MVIAGILFAGSEMVPVIAPPLAPGKMGATVAIEPASKPASEAYRQPSVGDLYDILLVFELCEGVWLR